MRGKQGSNKGSRTSTYTRDELAGGQHGKAIMKKNQLGDAVQNRRVPGGQTECA